MLCNLYNATIAGKFNVFENKYYRRLMNLSTLDADKSHLTY